jgi:hypothetical protein
MDSTNAALMATIIAGIKRCVEKGADAFSGHISSGQSFAEAEDVDIIMSTGQFRLHRIGDDDGSDASHFIGGDGHTDSRSADQNSPLRFMTGLLTGDAGGEFGIIYGLGVGRT